MQEGSRGPVGPGSVGGVVFGGIPGGVGRAGAGEKHGPQVGRGARSA